MSHKDDACKRDICSVKSGGCAQQYGQGRSSSWTLPLHIAEFSLASVLAKNAGPGKKSVSWPHRQNQWNPPPPHCCGCRGLFGSIKRQAKHIQQVSNTYFYYFFPHVAFNKCNKYNTGGWFQRQHHRLCSMTHRLLGKPWDSRGLRPLITG